MKRIFLLVALGALFLTACATENGRRGLEFKPTNMPEWARTGVHPDYPETEFLVAYALGRNVAEAEEVATSRLEAMICDYSVVPHATLLKDTHFEQIVNGPAGWFSLAEFDSAVRRDAASNGFEAVVMRAISYNELKLRARALLPAARMELGEADEPPTGLGSVPKRLEIWSAYFLLAMRVVALELLAADTLNRTAFDKVERALLSLWELPALVKAELGGADQYARIHGGAPDKLNLKVRFRGQPVPGVPILWAPATGFSGVVDGDRELNEAGIATAQVHYLAANGDDFGYVQARIDLDRVAGRRLGIEMSVWLWRVFLPSRRNGQLVLKVSETRNGGEKVDTPVFVPESRKWAEGRTLAVSEGEPDLVKYHYQLVVEGQVDVTVTIRDEVPSAYVSGTLTLSDMQTGQVFYRYSLGLERSGVRGNSEVAIAQLAMREAAAEAMAEFSSRIINALPAVGEEFGR